MSDSLTSEKVERASTNINTWIQIAIAIAVLGSIYGGFKASNESNAAATAAMEQTMKSNQERTDKKLEDVVVQVSDFKAISQKHEFILTALTSDQGKLSGQVEANQADDFRQWETIRQTESKANGAVQKTDFLEWRIELERKNPNVTSPPLKTQSP